MLKMKFLRYFLYDSIYKTNLLIVVLECSE